VRKHRLPRFKTQLVAIKLYGYDVRLEPHQVGDAAHLWIGLAIRPCRLACVTDVVVAAEPFVRAEGLVFHGGQRGLIDIGPWNVPTRREAGLVENYRPLGLDDGTVTRPVLATR
jgi:hypothetical protein